ncbi:cysteine protease [Lithospermum erythrorhizon]|uniref:ubiquitinyl hydrolase 1 n=1 Tax=Lithospermum erythrorhizon TaxID=34254 RepID=A0AAV3RGN3_LITER
MADRRVKEELITYAYIVLYIALSSGQIFFNKWVLSSNFPYPLGLTLLHMIFSSILCFFLTKVFKVIKIEQGMSMDIYLSSVIPIGAMFAMTLWLGNTAYLYISVSFAQMLKAIMPVAVFILGVLAGLEIMSCRMLLIMSLISFGVLVASYGEIHINWIGVIYQMGGVVGEALRLIFMEIFLKNKGLKLNPLSMMYYVSPCSAICLLISWIFLEKPKMDAQLSWTFHPFILTLNCLCTFALNLSVFLVISHTSALTIRVAGVVKDWVVVLLSALLFADTKLTFINLIGYAIAIAGVAAYNNHKLKKEASRVNTENSSQLHVEYIPFDLTIPAGSSGGVVIGGDASGRGPGVRKGYSASQMKRRTGPPVGLRNLGNSCYLNSVLQCLTYTPPLAFFCLQHLHSHSCDIGKLSAGEKKGECAFCIIEERISRHGRQEDAHEFLRYVIDACHNTCLRIKKLQQQRRNVGYIENGNANGHSVVKDIFGGALQSQVKCLSCGADSNKVDEMMDISLDVLHTASLKDALQSFFQPEILDGNNKYKCENCKKLVSARKQMSILQAPNVLVIQLKRFEGVYGGKIDKSIAFEEVLVLSSYMCKASQDPNPEYTLFGTIVHSGFSADTGHYYAYIKDAMGRWYCCNDSFVSLSSLKEVLSEKVYVLFFSRTKQRPGPSHTGVYANGAKSNELNDLHTSKILKYRCSEKPVPRKQIGLPHSQPLNPSSTKTSKSPPTLPRKPIVSDTNSKKPPKPPAAGCIKIVVHSRESMDKNGNLDNRDVKENPVLSMVERNGVARSKTGNAVNGGKMKSPSLQPVTHKNGVAKSESYTAGDALEKKSLTSQLRMGRNGVSITALGDNSGTERNKSLDTPANRNCVEQSESGNAIDDVRRSASLLDGNGILPSFSTDHSESHHEKIESNGTLTTRSPRKMVGEGCSDNTGLKRKFLHEDRCILLARDAESRIKVDQFKEVISREAASFLQLCGWSNKVYEHMHSRKKLCAQQDSCDASNHLELKRLLIADAKSTLISQIPEPVKGTLIERLKSFGQEKSSSIT